MKTLFTRNFAILVYLFFIPLLGLGQTYYVTTFAGSGLQGTANGLGAEASFSSPTSLKVDRSGNIYVSDDANHMIRKISPNGMVTTCVGSPNYGYRDGIGTNAQISTPQGMAIDSNGSIYLCDYGNNRIRKISSTGTVTTIAGSGSFGRTDGNGINASFSGPSGIVIDASGNLLVSDYSNHVIRKIDLQNNVTTFAGSGSYGYRNGIGISAVFNEPRGLAIDTNGNFIKEETYHHEMTGIAMNGHTNGYASAYSAVLKTTDAGQTWQYTTAKNDIYKSLLVLSNSDAIICGYDGSIKRTTDGGDTWLHIKNSNALTTTYRWNQLIQLNANIAVVIGDAGKIALVNLRDNSYNIISSIIAADILGGCKKNSSTIALCCSNGEYIELGL